MGYIARKIVRIIIFLFYFNLCLWILANGIYFEVFTLTLVVLDQILYIADTLIRPATPREDVDSTTKMIVLLFLLHPFFLILLFYENLLLTNIFLSFLNGPIISIVGIIVYLIGAGITLASRVQLGRYGDGTTALKDGHSLLTKGFYKYIRHPLYSGALIGRIGIGLTFRSYLGLILLTAVYFVVFRKRMDIEEDSLATEFGEEYMEYMNQTKRLIPYIY